MIVNGAQSILSNLVLWAYRGPDYITPPPPKGATKDKHQSLTKEKENIGSNLEKKENYARRLCIYI